jgi:hypothetical protein
MRKLFIVGLAVAASMGFAAKAMADDIPVKALKLIIVDKLVATSSAKAVFVAKDAAVTKGASTDVSTVSGELDIAYDNTSGSFSNPSGSNWLVNKTTVAKYVNKQAPTGGATKVNVVKPGKLIKNVGKSLGDVPIDISAAPTGNVQYEYTITNGGTDFNHCGFFTGATCSHKNIAGDTGFKLVCKGNGNASPCGAIVD